ncbi:MAG: sporulation YhaL family protein [Bacillus sp. (in: firmicutes)]
MYIVISILVAGIVVSGIMAVKTGREERDTENEWIEQEGMKFLERMNDEKMRKLEKSNS